MDATGLSASEISLCKRLIGYANNYWIRKDGVIATMGTQIAVDNTCRQLQKLLVTANESGNFHLLVAAERIICNADLKHFEDSQQRSPAAFDQNIIRRALQEGARQMDIMNDKLAIRAENVKAFHFYSSATRIESEHDRANLPKDAIRKILSSHLTRLQNKTTGKDGNSNDELNMLSYRRINIEKAEHLYKAMQREALGIAPKKQKDQDQ